MPATIPVDDWPGNKIRLVDDIESFLSEQVNATASDPPIPRRVGRPPILPALALWAGLLVCVLRGFNSQLDLWRLLRDKGVWSFPRVPISDQAVYARLARAGTAPLETLLCKITDVLAARLQPAMDNTLAPFATEVVAMDCTTLDSVSRKLPALRGLPNKDKGLLPGKLQAVFDLRRQLWRTVRFTPDPYQNERLEARELAATVPKGSLIVVDLGYFGFAWFDWLTDNNYHWVSRLRGKTSYDVLHTFYRNENVCDGMIWLGKHRADRAAHAVRLVTFTVGRQTRSYITNVTDPDLFPPLALAQVYSRRWDIEMAFNLIKTHLGLHLLWSANPVVIQQQILAVLIISQVIQALRLEIAWRADVDIFEVSLPLLIRYFPWYARDGMDPVEAFVERGAELGFIRASRRTRVQAPPLPETITPFPPDLVLKRKPRYAGRRC
ncbi:MAG: hypothetical protein CL694_05300 [Chloroflexi bacterium]|nr:hypothetical protein [Chloroflexota bacterium]